MSNVDTLTNQILAFMEQDESFQQVIAGSRVIDSAERQDAAERMALHLLGNNNPVDPDGYHAIGHQVLDYWTEWQAAQLSGVLSPDAVKLTAARIVRDVKLLTGILDHKVLFEQLLVEALRRE